MLTGETRKWGYRMECRSSTVVHRWQPPRSISSPSIDVHACLPHCQTPTLFTSFLVASATAVNMGDRVGSYRVWWSGGPGVEVWRGGGSSCTNPMSIISFYGKLWAESLVELPLPWNLQLKLRSQSSAVVPWEPAALRAPPFIGETPAGQSKEKETASAAVHDGSLDQDPLPEDPSFSAHPYFWATQGPRWDAKLLRGFSNDYQGLHHAKWWYTILSAELSRRKAGKKHTTSSSTEREGTALKGTWSSQWLQKTEVEAFVNACLADSVRASPRASVGFSLVSDIPRLSITAFNEAIPTRFECSFSWFAALKAGGGVQLESGLQPHVPADRQYMRISPVETFHHAKCGLTWRF